MIPSAPFNIAKSIYAGRTVIKLKVLPQQTGVTAATDTLTTLSAHNLAVGQTVDFISGTGFTGLVAGTTYFVVNVPSSTTYKLGSTLGGTPITVGTSTAGVLNPCSVFESVKLEHKDGRKYAELKRCDSVGIQRVVRKVCIEGAEEFTYQVDEIKRMINELFSGALTGIVTGTATIWEPDPQDATGFVAMKSETDFACTVNREGNFILGDGKISTAAITISSLKPGDVAWTTDATA